jgi:hypothetical protein
MVPHTECSTPNFALREQRRHITSPLRVIHDLIGLSRHVRNSPRAGPGLSPIGLGICPLIAVNQKRAFGDRSDASSPLRTWATGILCSAGPSLP